MSRLSAYSRWKVTGPFAAAAYIIATVAGRLPGGRAGSRVVVTPIRDNVAASAARGVVGPQA